jgi:hypothetical protein
LACLRALGVEVDTGENGTVTLLGRGFGQLCSPSAPLDAGNSGTTMRLLAGVLAGHPFSATLVGDASLSRRPMRRVMTPLERMGARFQATDGHAPLTIQGTRLHAIAHEPETPSAQIKGVGIFNYHYSEDGQFLATDGSIFNGNFAGSGTSVGPIVLGGIRVPVGSWGVGGELKYQWAEGTLPADQDFSGSKIDLGGFTYSFTINVRF